MTCVSGSFPDTHWSLFPQANGYCKALKQRVSISYNRRHARVGTLWEERYKSVLVDGSPGGLSAVAA
jgi:hypothetical protein